MLTSFIEIYISTNISMSNLCSQVCASISKPSVGFTFTNAMFVGETVEATEKRTPTGGDTGDDNGRWTAELLCLTTDERQIEKELAVLYKAPVAKGAAAITGPSSSRGATSAADTVTAASAAAASVEWLQQIAALHNSLLSARRSEAKTARDTVRSFRTTLAAGAAGLRALLAHAEAPARASDARGPQSARKGAGAARAAVRPPPLPAGRPSSAGSVARFGRPASASASSAAAVSAAVAADPDRALEVIGSTFDGLAKDIASWKGEQRKAYASLAAQAAELEAELRRDAAAVEAMEAEVEADRRRSGAAAAVAVSDAGGEGREEVTDDTDASTAGGPPAAVAARNAATAAGLQRPQRVGSALAAVDVDAGADLVPQSANASTSPGTSTSQLRASSDGREAPDADAAAASADLASSRRTEPEPDSDASLTEGPTTGHGHYVEGNVSDADGGSHGSDGSADDRASSHLRRREAVSVGTDGHSEGPLTRLARQAADAAAASDDIAAAVKRVESSLAARGGDGGGWPKDDHVLFLAALVAWRGTGTGAAARDTAAAADASTRDFAARLVATQLPSQTVESVAAHVAWYDWRADRLAERRKLLQQWRQAKEAATAAQRRLALARQAAAAAEEAGASAEAAAAAAVAAASAVSSGAGPSAGGLSSAAAADAAASAAVAASGGGKPRVASPGTRAAIAHWKQEKQAEVAARAQQDAAVKAAAAEVAATQAAVWRARRDAELAAWKDRQATLARRGKGRDDDGDSRSVTSGGGGGGHTATPAAELAARAADALAAAKARRRHMLEVASSAAEARRRRFGDYDWSDDDGDGDGTAHGDGGGLGHANAGVYGAAAAAAAAAASARGYNPSAYAAGSTGAHVPRVIGAAAPAPPTAAGSGSVRAASASASAGKAPRSRVSRGTQRMYAYVPNDPAVPTAAAAARATSSAAVGAAHASRSAAAAHAAPVASQVPLARGRSFTFGGAGTGVLPSRATPAWRKGL